MTKWSPKTSDYAAAIRSQNPWQEIGVVPAELSPPTLRPLAANLWRTLLDHGARRHQIILGPRRVGKTTVMYQTVRQLLDRGVDVMRLWWLRLDHPLLMDWPLGDLVKQIIEISKATPQRPAFVFLDELSYADKWDLWLKTFFDEKWPVRIVGTSSATAAIRQRGAESGVGRWDEQFLAPYLFTEYLDLKNESYPTASATSLGRTIDAFIERGASDEHLHESRRRFLLTGGFPELLIDERRSDEASDLLRSQRILRTDAIEKALYKDIPQAFAIQETAKLERLLYVLAGQMTGLLSPNSIASSLQVTAPTVDKYVEYLERAFIVFTLPNYSSSEKVVQRRGKRVYFVDGAVRNAALLRGISPISDRTELGMLMENMAASHLRSLAYQENVRLYHWRERNHEVDLVYDHPGDRLAIEMSLGPDHHRKGLRAFQERHPEFRGGCYLVAEGVQSVKPTLDTPGAIPFDLFLVAVGVQENRALHARVRNSTIAESDAQLLLF